jgi:hypothetical protein
VTGDGIDPYACMQAVGGRLDSTSARLRERLDTPRGG